MSCSSSADLYTYLMDIIRHAKGIFAEQGIPSQLATDNRPPYSSAEFRHFVNDYGVEHITIPERMVQNVESVLKKCDEEKQDPYIVYIGPENFRPDYQCLKGPCLPGCGTTREKLMKRQDKQAHYYN